MPITTEPVLRRAVAGFVVVALFVLVLGLLSGPFASAGPLPSLPGAPTTDVAAGAALTSARSLADGEPGTGIIAPELVTELGYTPVVEGTLASRASGDCSSPVPLPRSFESACRVHDLGYDLLRVARRHGADIPPGLRSDLDSLLGSQMRRSCDGDLLCVGTATVARAAVGLNTLRQGHGAPVEERLWWS